jgi:5-methyltetrahydropteroyltriglutamate--homocysteine methyltransferase
VLEQLKEKQVMVGCIDLSDMAVESPETIAARVRRALPYVARERVILAPDCGMKYLPREVAQGKLKAMVEAAKILRAEFA